MIDPAHTIIERFGGAIAVSFLLGIDVTRVRRWAYPKNRGGTGGTIPQRHHRALLDEARKRRIKLKAEDFIPGATDNARAA